MLWCECSRFGGSFVHRSISWLVADPLSTMAGGETCLSSTGSTLIPSEVSPYDPNTALVQY